MDLPLTEQLSKLQDILSSIRSAAFWESLPIIDETREGNVVDIHENDLPGLRHLRMSIQKEIETIESVSTRKMVTLVHLTALYSISRSKQRV